MARSAAFHVAIGHVTNSPSAAAQETRAAVTLVFPVPPLPLKTHYLAHATPSIAGPERDLGQDILPSTARISENPSDSEARP
jgi:hypothetical protein